MSPSESRSGSVSESAAGPEPRQRVFFALWPDAEARAALAAVSRQHARGNGRALAPDNLHITLAFVGAVTPGQRACMEAAAASVMAPRFAVTLDRLGFWPKPKILWAGAGVMPSGLMELVSALNSALLPCGYQPESRPFQVHVTLARKARRPPDVKQIPPIAWPADAFCLVESVTGEHGSEYRVIGRWPLRD